MVVTSPATTSTAPTRLSVTDWRMGVPNANASWRDRMSRRGGDRLRRGLFGDNRAHGFLPPPRWVSWR